MLLDVSCWNMPSTIYFNKIAKIAFSIEMEKFFFFTQFNSKGRTLLSSSHGKGKKACMKFFLISAKALSQLHFPLHSPLQGWSNLTLIRGETFTKKKISLDWVNREYSVIKKIMDDEISFSFWCLEIWARSNLPLELGVIPNGLVCLFRLFFFRERSQLYDIFFVLASCTCGRPKIKKRPTDNSHSKKRKELPLWEDQLCCTGW